MCGRKQSTRHATSLQVVLDFEWTADNRRPVKPISEITQFPSVLVRLEGHKTLVVDEFNTYVRPTLNKVLPEFSTQLTGITQEMVDRSPTLQEALPQYMSWLKSHRLVGEAGERIGSWAFCTWSDADIAAQLVREFHFKKIEIPSCFDQCHGCMLATQVTSFDRLFCPPKWCVVLSFVCFL